MCVCVRVVCVVYVCGFYVDICKTYEVKAH